MNNKIFQLTDDAYEAVKSLAYIQDVSVAEVIKRAISTELFLSKEKSKGNKILIRDIDGKFFEILGHKDS